MTVKPTRGTRRNARRAAAMMCVLASIALAGCVQTREQRQEQRFGSDYGGFQNDQGAMDTIPGAPQSFGSGR